MVVYMVGKQREAVSQHSQLLVRGRKASQAEPLPLGWLPWLLTCTEVCSTTAV